MDKSKMKTKRYLKSLEFGTHRGLCEFLAQTNIKQKDIQQIIKLTNYDYNPFVIFFWTNVEDKI
jgi:hypothetical protein